MIRPCEEILDLLPDHLPRLSGEALEVHEHLRMCHACSEAADEVAETLHALGAQPAAPTLSDDFADRVMASLPAQVGAAPAGQVISPAWITHVTRAAAAIAIFSAGIGVARTFEQPPAAAPTVAQLPVSPSPQRSLPQVVSEPQGTEVARVPAYGSVPGASARPAAFGMPAEGLSRYVSEAGLVLRAVNALDRPDPRWLDAMALHISDAALLEQGERLLQALGSRSQEPELLQLISGTQMLLLKLRNAQAGPTSVRAVRLELRQTGILQAYDALLEAEAPPQQQTRRVEQTDPL